MDEAVRQFLADLPQDVRAIVSALRALVLSAAGPTAETLVWRSLSYHRPELGGRVKGAVCLITPKSGHVELGFIHGVLLPDPGHLLTGQGRSKRVVRITSAANVRHNGRLRELVRAAAAIRPGEIESDARGPARRCTSGHRN